MSKTMNELVAEFPSQLGEAMRIASEFKLERKLEFENVLICGLGGSGIGATILSQLVSEESPFPIGVSKDYSIPSYVNQRTLFIACSYSGNTEETLEALNMAVAQKAQIACVTSGGKLLELAKSNHWPVIQIPSGYPPRAAFGFSMIQLLRLASATGIISDAWEEEMLSALGYIESNQSKISKAGHQLAEALQTKIPVIYASNWLEGVATRWRQQINENAKMLCWHHYYPEMNHNELVGWRTQNHNLAVVFLTSDFDHNRVAHRMELSETIIRKYTPHIHHSAAVGSSKIEQIIYLIHLGDWMSVHLADMRKADSTEVEVIDWLKGELAKF